MKTGVQLIDDISAYESGAGHAAFWWLGQQGFIVKTGGVTLVMDPYLNPKGSRLIPPMFEPSELTIADYIFGSHDHGDHIDHYAWSDLAKASPKAKFVVPELFVSKLSKEFDIEVERFVGLTDETIYRNEEQKLTITGIAAAHEFLSQDPVTGLYPFMSYIVEVDGVRCYHAGDTCKYDGLEKKLIEQGPYDVMFVPINGRDGKKYRAGTIGNMDFREAVDLCGMVKPGLAVPAHYDMFENNSANPIDFIDFMEAKYPEQKVWIGAHGERVTL